MVFIIPLGIGGLANALSKLRVSSKLIALLLLTYRFIFVMYERVWTASLSLRMRRPASMPSIQLWRAYAAMLASAIIGAEMRSQKVWTALQSRGFDGVFPLTHLFRWTMKDTAFIVLSIILMTALLVLDNGH
jgi:cobalt/nickel transport system permease protein